MVYLDNAATSFPKPDCVIKDTLECIKKYCGNPGRSSHRLSMISAEKVYEAREAVSELFGLSMPEGVVFTNNATYALNLAIKSYAERNCRILCSDIEHNSVIRPLKKLEDDLGIRYSYFNAESNTEEDIRKKLTKDTRVVIANICSNVYGCEIDLELLSKLKNEYGFYLIIDASQAAGHMEIDLTKTPCDCICAPGHKGLFGIQGSGFALFTDNKVRKSLIEGGSGSDSISEYMPKYLPEGYEAGTLSTPAIVSLLSGIRFINDVGICAVKEHIQFITKTLEDRIQGVNGSVLYPVGHGIISFKNELISPEQLAYELLRRGIYTRAGLHCAPSAHKKLGTLASGTIRLSPSYFNTKKDADQFYRAYREIISLP